MDAAAVAVGGVRTEGRRASLEAGMPLSARPSLVAPPVGTQDGIPATMAIAPFRSYQVPAGRQQQERDKSPRRDSQFQEDDNQAFTDGTTGLKGCSLTLPKYSKRSRSGSREFEDFENMGRADSARGSLKALESFRGLARASSPRTSDRGWVPGVPMPTAQEQRRSLANRRPSPPRQHSPQRQNSPPRQSIPGLRANRPVDKCHSDLYEDAFARQQRLRDMQQHMEQAKEREEQKRVQEYGQSMKEWKRLYKLKDTRSQAEREEEMIKKRKDKETRRLEMERERELDELRECTFQPILRKTRGERARSPRGMRGDGMEPSSLSQLLERQRCAVASLQDLAAEDMRLRDHLASVHAEYHDRIQREETQRVVTMLQDADTEGSAQRELIDRVRRMVAAGDDAEVAQRQIVEELVARSQDEVKRRVLEAFGPIQLEAEGKLYHKRLSLVHELESIEAQVVALRGGTLVQEARDLGFEFGLAGKSRQTLPDVPVLSAMRVSPPDEACEGGAYRQYSTSSSNPSPRQGLGHGSRVLSAGNLMRPSTPRSQAATSDGPSRQSSGQQPSLSGSVLQPRVTGDSELEAFGPSSSVRSFHSDGRGVAQLATSSSMPGRPRLGTAPAAFGLAGIENNRHASSYSGMPVDAVDAHKPGSIQSTPQPDPDEVAFINGSGFGVSLGGNSEPGTTPGGSVSVKAAETPRGPGGSRSRTPTSSFSDQLPAVSQIVGQQGTRTMMVMAPQPGSPRQQMVMPASVNPPQSLAMSARNTASSSMITAVPQQQLQQQLPAPTLSQSISSPAMMVAPGGYLAGQQNILGLPGGVLR